MGLFLDENKRKEVAFWWLRFNLAFLHICAAALVIAAIHGDVKSMDGETIRLMFSTCMAGIGVNLLLMITDKVLDPIIGWISSKFGPDKVLQPGQKIEETRTTVITPQPAVQPSVDNLNVSANNVNVNDTSGS